MTTLSASIAGIAGSPPPGSRLARVQAQLCRKGLYLRFEPGLEAEYLANSADGCAQQARAGLALGVTLMSTFLALDYLVLGKHYPVVDLMIYFFGLAPLILLVLGLSYTPRLQAHTARMNYATMLISAVVFCSTTAQLAITADRPPYGFETLVLYVAFVYFFSGAMFHAALAIAFTATTLFMLGVLWSPVSNAVAIYCLFFLVATNCVGIGARYMLDKAYRRNYLTRLVAMELAERDPLTGVYNRRVFEDRLDVLLRQSQRERCSLTVLTLDIDHFKRVNDEGGHALGDQTLRNLAEALRDIARRPLDSVARLGGDEFAALWMGLPDEEVEGRVADLVNRFAIRNAPPGTQAGKETTLSIGVAHAAATAGYNCEDFLHAADAALYRVKASGRAHAAVETLPARASAKSGRLQSAPLSTAP